MQIENIHDRSLIAGHSHNKCDNTGEIKKRGAKHISMSKIIGPNFGLVLAAETLL